MKLSFWILSLLLLLTVLGGCQKQDIENPDALSFRFDIASARTEALGDNQWLFVVDVLMNKEAFSEANLNSLFCHFGKQYGDRNHLCVRVYISSENYQKSLEESKEQMQGNDVGANSYCDAIFHKIGEREWFMYSLDFEHGVIYNFNASGEGKAKIVAIKGIDLN